MKIYLNEKGVFHFDLRELVGNLTPEMRSIFYQELIWDKATLDSFVEDLTGRHCGPSYNRQLYEARLKLVEKLPEAISHLVGMLLRDVEQKNLDAEAARAWGWKLWHSWPEDYLSKRPQDTAKFEFVNFPVDAASAAKLQGIDLADLAKTLDLNLTAEEVESLPDTPTKP